MGREASWIGYSQEMAVLLGIVVHADIESFQEGEGVLGVVIHVSINMFWNQLDWACLDQGPQTMDQVK